MGLSRTVSEINGEFSRKSQIFPSPRIEIGAYRVYLSDQDGK